jgi:hypothetical protein
MAKNKTQPAPVATTAQPAAPTTEQPMVATNHTLTYRKVHPQGRCSYGVAGVAGIVVFDLKLFADGKPPATIVLDCALALPVAKTSKPVAA